MQSAVLKDALGVVLIDHLHDLMDQEIFTPFRLGKNRLDHGVHPDHPDEDNVLVPFFKKCLTGHCNTTIVSQVPPGGGKQSGLEMPSSILTTVHDNCHRFVLSEMNRHVMVRVPERELDGVWDVDRPSVMVSSTLDSRDKFIKMYTKHGSGFSKACAHPLIAVPGFNELLQCNGVLFLMRQLQSRGHAAASPVTFLHTSFCLQSPRPSLVHMGRFGPSKECAQKFMCICLHLKRSPFILQGCKPLRGQYLKWCASWLERLLHCQHGRAKVLPSCLQSLDRSPQECLDVGINKAKGSIIGQSHLQASSAGLRTEDHSFRNFTRVSAKGLDLA